MPITAIPNINKGVEDFSPSNLFGLFAIISKGTD
jgi:hypothetical protein